MRDTRERAEQSVRTDDSSAPEPRAHGRVAWFSTAKGYGFITTAEGDDVFVRYVDIHMDGFKCLETGQEVDFLRGRDDHGVIALDVRVR